MTYPDPGGADASEDTRRSRTKLLAAAGFLLVVVLCLVIVLVTGGKGSDQAASAPDGAPAASPNSARDLDQTTPTTAPPGVRWGFFRGVALPSSPIYGPTRVNGDVAAGYAHSPVGALLAAVNISTRYGFAPGWRAVLEQQTVPGPGREAWIAIRAQHPIDPNSPSSASNVGQLTGFRFVNYSPQLATVQIVTQFAAYGGSQQMSTLTVQWNGQDWLLALQPSGGPTPPPSPVSTLDGFVPWSPS